ANIDHDPGRGALRPGRVRRGQPGNGAADSRRGRGQPRAAAPGGHASRNHDDDPGYDGSWPVHDSWPDDAIGHRRGSAVLIAIEPAERARHGATHAALPDGSIYLGAVAAGHFGAVEFGAPRYDLQRIRPVPPPLNGRVHPFELLVDREEVLDLTEVVRRHILQIVVVVVERVVHRDCQDLLVQTLLVPH